METQATAIATLNDRFRNSGQGITVTQGVQALDDLIGLINEIRQFNDFNEDNDPYGETSYKVVKSLGGIPAKSQLAKLPSSPSVTSLSE